MSGPEDFLQSRELSPEEQALRKEEAEEIPPSDLSPAETRTIEKTWREMRRLRPDLYVVFKSWVELFKLREDSTQYSHGVYRGFYAEMAQRLYLTEPAVTHRLKKAKLWFVNRLEKNNRNMSLR